MFSKVEIAGIGLSITAMIAALYLVTHNTATDTPTNQVASTGTVFVSEEGDSQTNLRNAIAGSMDSAGNVERLIVDDVVIGTGDEVKTGDTVIVDYIGTLVNGQEFDNSHKRGTPFTFTVGAGKVIKGWDEGVVGMKAGGKRILVIPSELAYGEKGYGPIPGNASLVFAIDLVSVTGKADN